MAKNRIPGQKSLSETSEVKPQVPEVIAEAKVEPFTRTFSRTQKIVSDVFKLLAAPVIKQVGIEKDYNKAPDDFKEFEHTHVFRTFDTDGLKHTKCCATAGHYHVIEWDYDEKGIPVIASVSGPMVNGRKIVRGKHVVAPIPANNYDTHTHDFQYLQSHEVDARRTNIEAQKVIAIEAQKGAPVSGVQER